VGKTSRQDALRAADRLLGGLRYLPITAALWRLVPLKDSTVLYQNERRFVGAPVSRLKFLKVGFVLDCCSGQEAASTDSVNRAVRVYAEGLFSEFLLH
jgi:hypothetical protein